MKHRKVDFKKVVGQQVRRLRHGAGLTQDVLSERCGIYRTYLSRIEAGSANPTLLVLIALASTLDVHVSELFREPEEVEEVSKPAGPGRQRKT
jgi:transcriptional regulator with XRE-family HTH domain